MDWCVQLSGFLGMSVHNPYILLPCRTGKTGPRFFWGPANQQARQKTVQRKPLKWGIDLTRTAAFPTLPQINREDLSGWGVPWDFAMRICECDGYCIPY